MEEKSWVKPTMKTMTMVIQGSSRMSRFTK